MGPYEWASRLMGTVGMSYLIADDLELVEMVFEKIGSLIISANKVLATMGGIGAHRQGDDLGLDYEIDGFHFGDDWGQQSGLIMGPELLRKFIKPRMARMYEKVKAKGKFVSQHSCGDIHEIFPDLIEIGLDVYQTFQPEIYDIKRIKEEYGQHLCFWGGISTQRLLPYATPEEVRKTVSETLKILGKNGGYIAGPTHSISGDVPVENVLTLIDILQNQLQKD